jgi:hypothetical protein
VTYPPLLAHILGKNEYNSLLQSPDVERHREEWRKFFEDLLACPPEDGAIADRFHTKWHESHHRIRELVADDDLMIEVMRVWLPRYDGPSLVLYRGENIDRFEIGRIGTAWSSKEETARMFAAGLNAVRKGGVILRIDAPADAIIAGPSAHSAKWLMESEYTVDIRRLGGIVELRRFPASH